MRLGVQDYEFRRLVGMMCEEDARHHHIPDYAVSFDGTNVRFVNRNTMPAPAGRPWSIIRCSTRKPTTTPGPWRRATTCTTWRSNGGAFWVESGKPELKNPDAAFIGFCKSRHERKPVP